MADGMAQQIVDEAGSEFSLAEEVDREFLKLHSEASEMADHVTSIAKKLRRGGTETVTHAELAGIYDTLSGDILSLFKDLIQLTGSSTKDMFTIIEEGGDDDEEEESEGPDQDSIMVYSTLRYNMQVFEALLTSDKFEETEQQALQNQIAMNQTTLQLFKDQFGDEIEKAYQGVLQGAEAATGVAVSSGGEEAASRPS